MTKKIKGKKTEFFEHSQTTVGFCEACSNQTTLYKVDRMWLCGECKKYGERKFYNELGQSDMSFESTF